MSNEKTAKEIASLRDQFAMQALIPFMTWALDQPHFVDYASAAKACAGYAKSAYLDCRRNAS